MGNLNSIHVSSAPTDEELAQWQQQLEAQQGSAAPGTFDNVTTTAASTAQVTMKNGQLVTDFDTSKAFGPSGGTAYAAPQLRPGHIMIPGAGETTIAAAKAGGLIPHTYKEGDPLPFDAPGGAKDTSAANSTANGDQQKEQEQKELTVPEHRAKVASELLQGVDQMHGAHVTDGLLALAVEDGEPLSVLDQLPEGVSEPQVMQVYAGYVAQAEAVLSERAPGVSIDTLNDTLSDDELRAARHATVNGDADELARFGQMAQERLAGLPNSDPEGFQQMVDDMSAVERKCISFDKLSGEWRVSVPNHPVMSYGAAVRMGLIRV
ncbi:hypothetical protein DC366_00845 [Pelagivirga sediminicola]|uniref:Uncharacterized protein n=1 Tax=Pelagivirga sediminicola TaxID=2170575 RepID=A0A2T7GAW2_9RHOB|nr:hypothetical protein [Pelagivirga sediminicola]PVA11551.1 hypothetical protein DC366_00845 [Pelagivirga sediminicola]